MEKPAKVLPFNSKHLGFLSLALKIAVKGEQQSALQCKSNMNHYFMLWTGIYFWKVHWFGSYKIKNLCSSLAFPFVMHKRQTNQVVE